jgi:hypothetical protein
MPPAPTAVLRGTNSRPTTWLDRAVLGALSRLLLARCTKIRLPADAAFSAAPGGSRPTSRSGGGMGDSSAGAASARAAERADALAFRSGVGHDGAALTTDSDQLMRLEPLPVSVVVEIPRLERP